MRSILRIFSYVRELESGVDKMQEVYDKLRVAEAERDSAREQRDSALKDALDARAIVADWLAELHFGRPIFNPKAPMLVQALPSTDTSRDIDNRVQGRALVAQRTQEFEQFFAQKASELTNNG